MRLCSISGPAGWDGERGDPKAKARKEGGRKLGWQHLTYQVALQRNVGREKKRREKECVKKGRYPNHFASYKINAFPQ